MIKRIEGVRVVREKSKFVAVINRTKGCRIENVEVASRIAELIRGLMFRSEGCMLLDFKREKTVGIWTLFMKYPLTIAFVRENGEVTGVVENAPPLSLDPKTWKIYYPSSPVRYVLELDKRAVKRSKFDVEEGDVLKFVEVGS